MDHPEICADPRILFIDAYDSFANNIVALLQDSLGVRVTTIHIDDPAFPPHRPEDFHLFLDAFDAVVAGPGPGTVVNPLDTGLISRLWTLPDDHLLPVLGICLGFQSLAYAFGATIERLPEPRHGIITRVVHQGASLFQNLKHVHATQYHSLHVKLGHPLSNRVSETSQDLWTSTAHSPHLTPLAWDCDCPENGAVLMAVEHASKPLWGVQYHPESICTDAEGAKVIQNWWIQARTWLSSRKRVRASFDSGKRMRRLSTVGHGLCHGISNQKSSSWDQLYSRLAESSLVNRPGNVVAFQCLSSTDCDVRRICELLEIPKGEAVVLESGLNKRNQPVRAETGSRSIIGCLDPERNLRVEYHVEGQVLELRVGPELLYREAGVDIWAYLKHLMSATRIADGPPDSPFWGGLIGFVSYEAGLETINVHPAPQQQPPKPDLAFAFVTRSIVIDHVAHTIHIQTLRGGDDATWLHSTAQKLRSLSPSSSNADDLPPNGHSLAPPTITTPTRATYTSQVHRCQSSIRAGDSYELCLTAPTTIRLPSPLPPWSLYRRLRAHNPAPFGAYIRFPHCGASASASTSKTDEGGGGGLTILSSSPERFLSWTRSGSCQYRPIKGTVRKADAPTRAEAERVLGSAKERAENLMIVDLVRHDLCGVVGAGGVRVAKLMGVEGYETVWQLVSVVEGELGPQGGLEREGGEMEGERRTGVDVLHASLPPGSMTGAPKKRSCELLGEVEGGVPRGVYAGVLGYVDVGGGGDFAVVIRTAWRWGGEGEEGEGGQTWRVGAGGAVTAQSDADAEYEEMVAKLESVLGVFDGGVGG